jgi:serine/threonine protein phosphatase PrpC
MKNDNSNKSESQEKKNPNSLLLKMGGKKDPALNFNLEALNKIASKYGTPSKMNPFNKIFNSYDRNKNTEKKDEKIDEDEPSKFVRQNRANNISRTTKITGNLDVLKRFNKKINTDDYKSPEKKSNFNNNIKNINSPIKFDNEEEDKKIKKKSLFSNSNPNNNNNNNNNININVNNNNNINNNISNQPKVQEYTTTKEFYSIKQSSTVLEFSYREDQNIANEDTMEDKGRSIENFNNDKNQILFELFDGHGGESISHYLQNNFDRVYRKNLKLFKNDYENCFKTTFKELDMEIKKLDLVSMGSTACIIHIIKETPSKLVVHCANCGDTRASLISPMKFKRLSYDHRADDEEEKRRVQNSGGTIINNRVMGALMLSRAFGDFELKSFGVKCEPYYSYTEIDLNEKNQFVILACDGVWDLNTESDFQQLIMFCNDSEMLCSTIIKNTLRKDAWDNLSVFAIKLT